MEHRNQGDQKQYCARWLRHYGQRYPVRVVPVELVAGSVVKDVHVTLYSAILREMDTKGSDARFKKTESGMFGLKG